MCVCLLAHTLTHYYRNVDMCDRYPSCDRVCVNEIICVQLQCEKSKGSSRRRMVCGILHFYISKFTCVDCGKVQVESHFPLLIAVETTEALRDREIERLIIIGYI